jgi:cytochrome c oxidase assembly protein subunit 15
MSTTTYQPAVHRFAVATACVALLPITIGALVTTMNWGMAFLDWPSSDGQNMLLYPWLRATTDKFAEHGHRLGGMLIGIVSAAMMIVAWIKERRLWVRVLATVIPFCVLAQGILGGMRVLANDPRMAMFHGAFAAVVFTLMAALSLFTGRRWIDAPINDRDAEVDWLKPFAIAAPLVLAIQYLLGGTLRHLGISLYEHIGLAVLVFLVVIAAAVGAFMSRAGQLRRFAWWLPLLVGLQVVLGLGAFATKYGYAPMDYVAVQRSTQQILLRTSHTLVGMLLLTTATLFALSVYRLAACGKNDAAGSCLSAGTMRVEGGAS